MATRKISEAYRKMQLARSNLIMENQAFFGQLAFKLELVEDPSCDTCYTNGLVIGFNPEYIMARSLDETIALVCEEVMHNANGHSWRRDNRDPREWNEDCDKAIMGILVEAGMKIPADSCYDPAVYGKSAEWINAQRPKKPPPSPKPQPQPGGGSGSGQPGEGDDSDEDEQGSNVDPVDKPQKQPPRKPFSGGEVRDLPAKEDKAAIENDWKIAAIQAATAAQGQGKLPAGIEQLLDEIRHPAVDWKSWTRRWLQDRAKNDFSMSRPSQRWMAQGMYMPSLRSQNMPAMVFGFDCSGSLDNREGRAKIAPEALAIFEELRPDKLYVVYFDAEVQRVECFEPGDTIELHPKGGGGTDFRCVTDWIAEQDFEEPIACLVMLTDADGTFPDQEPEFPVLWTVTGKTPVPWGERIQLPS